MFNFGHHIFKWVQQNLRVVGSPGWGNRTDYRHEKPLTEREVGKSATVCMRGQMNKRRGMRKIDNEWCREGKSDTSVQHFLL